MTMHHDAQPPAAPVPLGRQLNLTAKLVRERLDAELAEAGGSLPVWLVLQQLRPEEGLTQRDVAACLEIMGPTLTHHIDRMEGDGLIERRRDPHDRRLVRLYVTPAGRQLHARLLALARTHDQRLTAGCEPSDVAAMRRVLDQIRANLLPRAGRPRATVPHRAARAPARQPHPAPPREDMP